MAKETKWIKAKRYTGVYSRVSEGERTFKGKPDVCWYVTYKKDSRLVWEKVGWASEGYLPKLATQIRAERVRMIRHGQELPRERARIPRFSEMADLYLQWGMENKITPNDKGRYQNHLKEPLGKKRLNEISSFSLEKLKSELVKKELAPATVKHCLVLVREIFNKAVEWGKYQGQNPVRGVKLPTLSNRRERFLSYDEADKLLKELAKVSRTAHDMALLSLYCGLRAGEIFSLRGQDLDFENGIINISDPKNKSPRKTHMTQTVKEILKSRKSPAPNEFIFQDKRHKDRVVRVSGVFQRAVEKLGFNDDIEDPRQRVVFHTLRHTFASWLAIQGTPILAIKELLGHRTLAMTERYAHLSPDVKKDATLALERSFEASRNGKKVIPLAIAKEIPVSQ